MIFIYIYLKNTKNNNYKIKVYNNLSFLYNNISYNSNNNLILLKIILRINKKIFNNCNLQLFKIIIRLINLVSIKKVNLNKYNKMIIYS